MSAEKSLADCLLYSDFCSLALVGNVFVLLAAVSRVACIHGYQLTPFLRFVRAPNLLCDSSCTTYATLRPGRVRNDDTRFLDRRADHGPHCSLAIRDASSTESLMPDKSMHVAL